MINHFDHMSIWDICHRWHGYDPDHCTVDQIPLEVKDTIKALSQGLAYCQMSVCDENGVEKKNPHDCPKSHQYWPHGIWRERKEGDPDKSKGDPTPDWSPEGEEDDSWYDRQIFIPSEHLSDEELDNQYRDFRYNWQRQHWKLIEGLDKTYTERTFDQKKLESVHINRSGLIKFCRENEIDIPEFWFTTKEIHAIKSNPEFDPDYSTLEDISPATPCENIATEGRLKQSDIDSIWERLSHRQQSRILCRSIAAKYWEHSPDRTIESIIKDDVLLDFGGGKSYQGKNTLRDWIKDIDPRPKNARLGRPKKTPA